MLADDDTVVVKCATTENGKQYDADLSNTVEQLLEFGRKYISFSVTTVTRAEVPAVKQLAPIFTQQTRRDCLPPELAISQICFFPPHNLLFAMRTISPNYAPFSAKKSKLCFFSGLFVSLCMHSITPTHKRQHCSWRGTGRHTRLYMGSQGVHTIIYATAAY